MYPATVTVESTTEVVLSATSTVTETVVETAFVLRKRSHVRKDNVQARAAAPVITPKAELPKRMEHHARQVASNAGATLDVTQLDANLSSACSCRNVRPLTTFLQSTAPAAVSISGIPDNIPILTTVDADHCSHRL